MTSPEGESAAFEGLGTPLNKAKLRLMTQQSTGSFTNRGLIAFPAKPLMRVSLAEFLSM